MFKKTLVSLVFVCVAAISASAQFTMFQTNSLLLEASMISRNCQKLESEGKPLPENCYQYKRNGPNAAMWGSYSGLPVVKNDNSPSKPETNPAVNPNANSKFTPALNDDSFQKFADSIGTSPQEKQLMLQIAANTKSAFEQQYGAKGWKNNLAGAFTFFILTTAMVYNDQEPSEASQDALFKILDQTLGSDTGMSSASNKDKTALYNSLIAYGGLPLAFYIDGKQKGDAAEVEKAKQLAAGFCKMILKSDPESLKSLVK